MSMATAKVFAVPPKPQARQLLDALDASRMRNVLSEALGETINHVSIERVLFSKSRPTVIHYCYQRAGELTQRQLIGELVGAGAQLFKETEIRRLAKARRSQIARTADQPLFHADALGLVLRRPGFDSNLVGLRLLHDKAFAIEMVAKVIGQSLITHELNVSLRAHRLGKRAVLLVECKTVSGTRHRIYIRLRPTTYEAGRSAFERHLRIVRAVQGATTTRIPTPLHFDADWGAAFFEELPGTTPDFIGLRSRASGALVGRALAELRSLCPAAAGQWSISDEIAGLTNWAGRMSEHLPQRLPDFNSAVSAISCRLADLPAVQLVACHRDFHESQLLVDAETCGILDFDTWCDADPALDIGNFLAHIRLWELRNKTGASEFESAFIAAASEGWPPGFAQRVAVWKQAALLRLAAIYAFSSEAHDIVSQLAGEAAA